MKRLSHGICVFLSYIIFLQIIALPGGCVALEWWLHSAGVTVRRYPMTEGREAQQDGRRWSINCVALEWLWGDTPGSWAKDKPQQDGRRGKIAFRIESHTHQRYLEGSNKSCVHQDPETPQRLRQNCIWVSPVEVQFSSGQRRREGLWVQQTWVWHKPSWRRSPLTPPQSCQNLHRTGK